jgi:hypothetical protein
MRCIPCLLLSCILILYGCKTESVKAPASSSEKPKDNGFFTIEGRVGPVWVENGFVSAHPVTESGVDLDTDVGAGRTNGEGEFQLTLESRHSGHPMILRVLVDKDSSRIRCIQTAGCGNGVSFGGSYQPDSSFQMFLVAPELRTEVFYSLTPLSHIAFRLIEDDLLSPLQSSNGVAGAQKQYLIAQSNTRVASRFGVVGDLVATSFADFTDAAEVTSASDSSIRASIVSVAAIQAALKTYALSNSADALERFSDQYLEFGLPGVADTQSVVGYTNIMSEGASLAAFVQKLYQKDMGGVSSEINASMYFEMVEGPGIYTRGTPSETSGLTSIEKAKSLASDVRTISTSIDLRKLVALNNFSAMVDGGATDALKQFGFKLDSMRLFDDSQFDHISDALVLTIEAAFASLADYYGKSLISTSYEGLNFAHVVNQDTHTFGFKTNHNVCSASGLSCLVTYDLGVSFKVVNFTGNANTFAPAVLDFLIIGTVTSGDLRIGFEAADQQTRFIRPSISILDAAEYGLDRDTYKLSADALRIRLPFELTKENMAAREEMKGVIALDVGKFDVEYTSAEFRSEGNGAVSIVSESEIKINQLEELKVNFSSIAKPADGDEFRGSINITQSTNLIKEPVLIKTNVVEHCVNASSCEEVNSETFIEGETQDSFLGLYAAMGFQSKLKGIAAPALLEVTGARLSPTTNNINALRISYPGHAVALQGRFSGNGIAALDAVNLDGMRLYFESVQNKRVGMVETSAGDSVADVIDMGQWVKIRYLNGDFESL